MFKILNLSASIGEKKLLQQINLNANLGDVIAIIGPNGSGKSTLFKTIMHHYAVKINQGQIFYQNQEITPQLPTYDIANLGIYYLNQNPVELDGVKLIDLYRLILDNYSKHKKETPLNMHTMFKTIQEKFNQFNFDINLLNRENNVNFSGGQKKKNELIQLGLINPQLILLDEVDSGCDVDLIDTIANLINLLRKDHIFLIISHQKQLLEKIKPNHCYVLVDGQIKAEGDYNFLMETLSNGFGKYEQQK